MNAPRVTNAYLSGNRLVLLHRDENGELRAGKARAEWSLFTKKEDLPKYEKAIRSSSACKGIRVEGDFVRVSFSDWDVRDQLVRGKRRDQVRIPGLFEQWGVTTYEADLSPVRRWLIDSGAVVQKPLPGYLDLETDPRVGFARLGEGRILCWGLVVRRKDGTVDRIGGVLTDDTDQAEREMLLDMFHELCDVDQILCWNGDMFDFVVLKNRILILRLEVDLRRWLLCDQMELYAKLNTTASDSGDEKASLALNRVAASLGLARQSAKIAAGGGALGSDKGSWENWKAGGERRQNLLEDCVEDAMTAYRIEHGEGDTPGTGYVSTLATLCETCGVFADSRGMRGVNYVESFLMRLGAARGMRAPTKFGYDKGEDHEKFKGAFVFPTRRGLFVEDVHICDFARLYPSIMQAWNMSPETYVGPALSGEVNQYGFAKKHSFEDACRLRAPGVAVCPVTREQFRIDGPRGLFAAALDIIVEQRKYWSNLAASLPVGSPERKEAERRDAAYKIIANTFYGVAGSIFSRYFLRELSESVTQIGVWLIQNTAASAAPDFDYVASLKEYAKKTKTEPQPWHVKNVVVNAERRAKPFDVLAGDTDSSLVRGSTEEEFRGFIAWCNKDLYPEIIKPTGADKSWISIAFEQSFSIFISVEKKTYAGRRFQKKGKRSPDDAAPVIKGLEFKRGDTTRLARDFQEEVVRKILMTGEPLPKEYGITPQSLEENVRTWQRLILDRGFAFDDAVIAQAIKKPLKEYGGTSSDGKPIPLPRHVKIATELEGRGFPIYPGVKVEYVVADGRASPQKCKAAIDATIADVDVFHLWESVVWPAAERVLSACFPDHPWNRWGAVRPLKTTLPGQEGFGWGERPAPPKLRLVR